MTTTINASTSAGLVQTADTSGVLALQTAGTTAVSISASQVVTLTNALPVASGGSGVTTSTGTGANVLGTSPTITTATLASPNITTALTLTGAAGTSGQALTSQGSGVAPIWSTIGASAATPTALGTVYGKTDTSLTTTNLGYQAGNAQTTGDRNVCIGYQANKSGTDSATVTAVGYQAIGASGNVQRSTAIGFQSLYSHVGSGSNWNTAVGWQSAYSLTTGGDNTAIGGEALRAMTTASDNTAVGAYAGDAVTTGVSNTYIGRNAGGTHATGNGCTYVGYYTRASTTSIGNEFVFGFNCVGNGGASMTIGDAVGQIFVQYRGTATWNQVSDIRLKKNITPDTLGLSFIQRLNPVKYQWKASNELDEDNPYYAEENVRDTEDVMHGLIAQEVKEALDAEGVTTFDGWKTAQNGMQAISHTMFVMPLIKAVQELKALNDTQATTITALTARIVALEGQ